MHCPLENLRIVELGHVIAGPLSAALLSAGGAYPKMYVDTLLLSRAFFFSKVCSVNKLTYTPRPSYVRPRMAINRKFRGIMETTG